MSLGERFSRLEERERRLLGVLIAIVVAAVLLAPPLALLAVVHSHQSDNEAVREALRSIDDEQVAIARSKAESLGGGRALRAAGPPLAAFLSKFASEVGIEIPESQDRQSVPHGKKFDERSTKITLRKVGMLKLLKFMEKIEQSGHPVQIAQINIRKRGSEPDSYDVDMVVSAFDRKEAPKTKADKDAGAEPPTDDEGAEEKP